MDPFTMMAASSAVQTAGSVYSARQADRTARSTNRANRELALEMARIEQEYNHPLAQMNRYREAGLNPAVMMAGHGSAGNVNVATPTAQQSEGHQHMAEALKNVRFQNLLEIRDLQNRVDISRAQSDIAKHDSNLVSRHPGVPSGLILASVPLHGSAYSAGVTSETAKIAQGVAGVPIIQDAGRAFGDRFKPSRPENFHKQIQWNKRR